MVEDFRPLAIETMLEDLADKDTQIVELTRDRDAYRLAVKVAIEQLAELTQRNKRLEMRMREMNDQRRDAEAIAA